LQKEQLGHEDSLQSSGISRPAATRCQRLSNAGSLDLCAPSDVGALSRSLCGAASAALRLVAWCGVPTFGGYFARNFSGRGRRVKSPPQLGHTPPSSPSVHVAQNVYSNVQIRASGAPLGSDLPQRSHSGRMSMIAISTPSVRVSIDSDEHSRDRTMCTNAAIGSAGTPPFSLTSVFPRNACTNG
jgi:hypothetical protein